MVPLATPQVTVMIPTFNATRFIDATIASVLRQTADCFEAIVVDDGSTADTVSRVAAFRDPRIRIVERSHESSSAAMNEGVRLARGECIALLDHDDLWSETRIPEELTSYRQHRGQQSRDWRWMEREWFVTLEKFRRSVPEITPALASRATSPRPRFYAYQAYKGGEFRTACRLAAQALCDAPGFFLTDLWSWKVSAVCLARPAPSRHRKLRQVVGIRE